MTFDVTPDRDEAYFAAIRAELADGGYEAMLYDLHRVGWTRHGSADEGIDAGLTPRDSLEVGYIYRGDCAGLCSGVC